MFELGSAMVTDHDQVGTPRFGAIDELSVGGALLDEHAERDALAPIQAYDLCAQRFGQARFERLERFEVTLVFLREERANLGLRQDVAHGQLGPFVAGERECLTDGFIRGFAQIRTDENAHGFCLCKTNAVAHSG